MVCLYTSAYVTKFSCADRNVLLAAFGSMRGGGRVRPDGPWPSDRWLKEAPPNVAARSSFVDLGEVGDFGERGAVADDGKLENIHTNHNNLLDKVAGAHT